MPQKRKVVYLSELAFEPMARNPHMVQWFRRSSPPFNGEDIRQAIDSLCPKERDVILRYFGFDTISETLESIARDYKCSREWIRRLVRSGLKHVEAILIEPNQETIEG